MVRNPSFVVVVIGHNKMVCDSFIKKWSGGAMDLEFMRGVLNEVFGCSGLFGFSGLIDVKAIF
jgi:hypothetical protein